MMIPLLIAAVVAAGQPAAKPVDPAALAAANVLVTQLDVRSQVQKGMNRNVELMRQGVAIRAQLAQQPGFIPAYQANQAKFDAALKKAGAIQADIAARAITSSLDAVVAAAAKSYATNYTADELKQLAAFYKTPLGQSLLLKQGRVSADIAQASEQIVGAKIEAGMKAAAPQLQAALAPLNSGAAPPKPPAKK
jgi:hypothetical protein